MFLQQGFWWKLPWLMGEVKIGVDDVGCVRHGDRPDARHVTTDNST